MWCSAADTHLKIPDRVVSDASILTGVVFECDLAHRRSMAVLCMLYMIRCNPMHPLCGGCPSCVVCASSGYTQCCYRTSVHLCAFSLQNLAVSQDFYSLVSISVKRSYSDPVFDCVELAGFKSRANAFLLA